MSGEKVRAAAEAAAELLARITSDGQIWALQDAAEVRDALQAALAEPAYHVPGPYEIALTVGAALAASGRYDTPGAALAAAWFSVPEFYQARDAYLTELAPAIYPRSPPPGGDQAEAAE